MNSKNNEINKKIMSISYPGFRGRYDHTIDTKGRLALPSRYRKVFEQYLHSQDVFITTHDHKNLIVFPMGVWVALEDEWTPLSHYDEDIEDHIFILSYNGQECSVDNGGRLLIPKSIRDETNLENDVVIIGKINHFEVWDRTEAKQHLDKIIKKKDSRERLAEIGAKIKKVSPRKPQVMPLEEEISV
ncbi:division/cell wall cluster transcriptional repressor MraZ [candidate division CSSED10-310 bacterium]|uniref:Transcriptional regulator MraZ n=1 Tax=candidate division CSSED10-310 bacterium TaxID=2855610 RepID=A0ABV6YVB0_UNCC1